MSNELRIAMWSGPRNISTAMMRAWGNRPDTFVTDEPLYAHYLKHTGFEHPMAAEVIEHHESDWKKVVDWLTGPIPRGKSVWYQKQMSHHLLPHIDRGWLSRVTNCFLIREPREVITSLIHFIPRPTLEDTGYPQQAEIFDRIVAETGSTPPVIDAKDVLTDPRRMLSKLCESLGVAFTDAMLTWPPGIRETDGVWARAWYKKVEPTTGFGPYRPKPDQVPDFLNDVHRQADKIYQKLYEHRL